MYEKFNSLVLSSKDTRGYYKMKAKRGDRWTVDKVHDLMVMHGERSKARAYLKSLINTSIQAHFYHKLTYDRVLELISRELPRPHYKAVNIPHYRFSRIKGGKKMLLHEYIEIVRNIPNKDTKVKLADYLLVKHRLLHDDGKY
jgi:hypothetical protein